MFDGKPQMDLVIPSLPSNHAFCFAKSHKRVSAGLSKSRRIQTSFLSSSYFFFGLNSKAKEHEIKATLEEENATRGTGFTSWPSALGSRRLALLADAGSQVSWGPSNPPVSNALPEVNPWPGIGVWRLRAFAGVRPFTLRPRVPCLDK
jgi:hypothetical protein